MDWPVMCCGCGRAYGVTRAQQAAGVPPHSTIVAGLAARLTGWVQGPDGRWFCGILDCKPASAA